MCLQPASKKKRLPFRARQCDLWYDQAYEPLLAKRCSKPLMFNREGYQTAARFLTPDTAFFQSGESSVGEMFPMSRRHVHGRHRSTHNSPNALVITLVWLTTPNASRQRREFRRCLRLVDSRLIWSKNSAVRQLLAAMGLR